MGWWNAAPSGASLMTSDTGLIWGDGPADGLDMAFDYIVKNYQERVGRKPTLSELEAGMTAVVLHEWNTPEAKAMRPTTMDDACMMTLQDAYKDVCVQFAEADWGREPTLEEMIAGVRFASVVLSDGWDQ